MEIILHRDDRGRAISPVPGARRGEGPGQIKRRGTNKARLPFVMPVNDAMDEPVIKYKRRARRLRKSVAAIMRFARHARDEKGPGRSARADTLGNAQTYYQIPTFRVPRSSATINDDYRDSREHLLFSLLLSSFRDDDPSKIFLNDPLWFH